jgi:hypothetical protein
MNGAVIMAPGHFSGKTDATDMPKYAAFGSDADMSR